VCAVGYPRNPSYYASRSLTETTSPRLSWNSRFYFDPLFLNFSSLLLLNSPNPFKPPQVIGVYLSAGATYDRCPLADWEVGLECVLWATRFGGIVFQIFFFWR